MIARSPYSEIFASLRGGRPKNAFSEAAAALRAERNAERGESEPESERPQREHDAGGASAASEASVSNDFVERFLLAGARRRGEGPCEPPPAQPRTVMMTAEGILAAGRKARGDAS